MKPISFFIKLFCIFSFFLTWQAEAQIPNFYWAESAKGIGNNSARTICTDQYGNVIVAGVSQSDTLVIGTKVLDYGSTQFNGNNNIFIAKYDPNGNVLWARAIEGYNDKYVANICTDKLGNIIVCGSFKYDTLYFGTYKIHDPGNDYQVFVAKYDPLGNLLWAKSIGQDNYDPRVCADNHGNVIVSAFFDGGAVVLDSTTFTNVGNGDYILLIKYDPAGNFVWAKGGAGTAGGEITGLKSDNTGNIIFSGLFSNTSFTYENISFNQPNAKDIFLFKCDSTGTPLWAEHYGGSGDDQPAGLCVEETGNIWLSGSFNSPNIGFDSIFYSNTALGTPRVFLANFNPSGRIQWLNIFNGNHSVFPTSLTIDSKGNAYTLGQIEGSIPIILGKDTVMSLPNVNKGLMIKYDKTGQELWNCILSSNIDLYGEDICVDPSDNLILSGSFSGTKVVYNSDTVLYHMPLISTYTTNLLLMKFENIVTGLPKWDISSSTGYHIYPNPALDILQIDTELTFDHIRITNSTGQTVIEKKANKRINISQLAQGLYCIQILDQEDHALWARKFIKE